MVRSRRCAVLALALAGLAGCGHASVADTPASTAAAARVAASPAEPASNPAGPRRVDLTVAVSGDLLIHAPVWQRAAALAGGEGYDFAPLLRHVRPWIAGADLALCQLETPMTSAPPSGFPIFNTPPALARAIRATGWDACSTASNHTLDQGQSGVDQTIAALRRAGVRHAGSAASRAGARRLLVVRRRGVKIAILAYTTTTNGLAPPHPWSVKLAEPDRIVRDARRARRRGARVVLVNLHWGDEYRHAPTDAQLRLARRLSRSPDITAVVGQHAHVVQPIRRVRGRWIVFGEGNLLSNQTAACCPAATQDGIIALLRIRVGGHGAARARVRRVAYLPTWVRHPDYAVLPVGRALRRGWAPADQLRASWHRTVSVVGRGPRLQPVPRRLPR